MRTWTIADIPSQKGKLAIVTGATGGLGYETALALARAGAEVALSGRNADKGRVAVERIGRALAAPAPSAVGAAVTSATASAAATAAANVRFEMLDLANLASVQAFADRMIAQGRPVDLLINNAGVMALPTRRTTVDGFEMQFGTNHLSHFALTAQLLPLLRRAASPRVVTVSSLAHRGGRIGFDNLHAERRYRPWPAYQQSKLANLLFAFELQRRSDAYGWGLMSNAAHPGYALTDLISNGPGSGGMRGRMGRLLRPLSHSAAAGALPTLFGATSPDATSMGYYGPNGIYELKGPPTSAYVARRAKDELLARKLWEVSEALTGVQWPIEGPVEEPSPSRGFFLKKAM